MTSPEQLVELVIANAPELGGVEVTPEQRERAVRVAREKTETFPKGDRAAFAALVDLIVHEITREVTVYGNDR